MASTVTSWIKPSQRGSFHSQKNARLWVRDLQGPPRRAQQRRGHRASKLPAELPRELRQAKLRQIRHGIGEDALVEVNGVNGCDG